jgi:cytochrome P450
VQRWFTPSGVERLRVIVRGIVEKLVDEMLAAGEHDVLHSIARPLPVLVMGEVVGLHGPDVDKVAMWMDSLFHTMGPDPAPEHQQRMGEFFTWLMPALGALPEDSMAKAIMDSGGDTMENIGVIASIWGAGIDTSTNLISTALHTLATNFEEWQRITDPASAVEECLRHRSPVRSFMRRTVAETDVLGHAIPADADVCVLYASANRDQRHYPEPNRFDAQRNPTDHLAFGSGIHLCLGAPLLRLEVGELFSCMRQRVERFELTGEPQPNLNPVIQGYVSLPMKAVPA